MKHLTIKKMTKLISMILSVATCLITGSGCEADDAVFPEGTSEKEKIPYVSFDVPEGWEKESHSENGSDTLGINFDSPEDSCAPYIMYEVHLEKGNEEDARKMGLELHEIAKSNKGISTNYYEKDMGGEAIYISEHRTESAYGCPWWSDRITLEKNGWVITLDMTDRVENQQEAVQLLVETINVELR